MKNFFLAVLAAFVATVTSSAAIAQGVQAPTREQVAMTESFVENLGMTEVLPNFYLSAQQMEELRTTQCTGGPNGLFNELREWMAREGTNWCSRETNSRLSRYFRSGAVGYTMMAGPTSVRLTVYDQAVNLNRNVRCIADIPYSGMFQLNFTCFDAQSGAQVRSQIFGQILGSAIPMWGATVLSNLTAPQAGDTNINVGSQSDSVSNSNSTGGGGAGPIYIDVTATGGQGGNAGANSTSTAEVVGVAGPGTCGTSACH